MRTVLDTNVVISSFLWGGAPSRLLKAGPVAGMQLFTSMPLLEELRETTCRLKFRNRLRISNLSVEELIDLYLDRVSIVDPVLTPRLAPDPDDDVVIGTAIAAKAEIVVTGDRALLSVRNFTNGRIVSVIDALALHGLS
jgi:putative PIN family toxin of toxin-antitoxin system